MHEIDRFIDSALALLSRHATILRVSLINYSFIGKQEKKQVKRQIPMGWIPLSSKEMLPNLLFLVNATLKPFLIVICSSQGTDDVIDAI